MAHILVVADDLNSRNMLRVLLEDEEYVVLETADGETAWQTLRAASEGLVVVLEHVLPAMTGLELLSGMARDADLASRHAYVLLTANPHIAKAHLADLNSSLHVALVEKPPDLDALVDAVDRAADGLDGRIHCDGRPAAR